MFPYIEIIGNKQYIINLRFDYNTCKYRRYAFLLSYLLHISYFFTKFAETTIADENTDSRGQRRPA